MTAIELPPTITATFDDNVLPPTITATFDNSDNEDTSTIEIDTFTVGIAGGEGGEEGGSSVGIVELGSKGKKKNGSLDPSKYPKLDAPPPVNSDWTKFYLKNAKIPNIPVRGDQNPNPNYDNVVTSCVDKNVWFQTFDDGPSQYTPLLLDYFKSTNTKTTFFIVGSRVVESFDVLKREVDEGHVNCIHTYSHTALTTQSNAQIVAEVVWTAKIIYDVTGRAPTCIRPPYGDVDDRVLAVLKAMGLTVFWVNRDSEDWKMSENAKFGSSRADKVLKSVEKWFDGSKDGGVLSLEHDLFETPVKIGIEANKNVISQSSSSSSSSSRLRVDTIDACMGSGSSNSFGTGFKFPPGTV
ncbi:chitin deacetylase [Blyttiomyces sp. JEL0837]|nr:chitin deacetylase [Blyttiomyces sp. JEL0837]